MVEEKKVRNQNINNIYCGQTSKKGIIMTKSQLHQLYHKINNLAYNTFEENNSQQRQALEEILEELSAQIRKMEEE